MSTTNKPSADHGDCTKCRHFALRYDQTPCVHCAGYGFPRWKPVKPNTVLTPPHGVQAAVGVGAERTAASVYDDGHAAMHRAQVEGPAVDPLTGRAT